MRYWGLGCRFVGALSRRPPAPRFAPPRAALQAWRCSSSQTRPRLDTDMQDSLHKIGIQELTPIQKDMIPSILQGYDVLAQSRPGTGKTIAFIAPVIQKIREEKKLRRHRRQALVIVPTRELAQQIYQVASSFAPPEIRIEALYGGKTEFLVSNSPKRGDVFISTPGKLVDLSDRKVINLDQISTVVVDEVDKTIQMGLDQDISLILLRCGTLRNSSGEEKPCQVIFCSATLTKLVKRLSRRFTSRNRLLLNHSTLSMTSSKVSHHVVEIKKGVSKPQLISDLITWRNPLGKTLVFVDKREEAESLLESRRFLQSNFSRVLHAGMEQSQRDFALQSFVSGKSRVLITTDVLGRGIDIKGIDLIINNEPPKSSEIYLHRSGRTGRHETHGESIVLYEGGQIRKLRQIESDLSIKFHPATYPNSEQRLKGAEKLCTSVFGKISTEDASSVSKLADILTRNKDAEGERDLLQRVLFAFCRERGVKL